MDLDITLSGDGELLIAEASSQLGECYGTSEWPRADQLTLDAHPLGELLFDRLLPGAVRTRYHQCRGRLAGSGGRLRVRIRAPVAATAEEQVRVHAIPWELVRDPDGGGLLALDPQVQLVRYLNVATPVPDPLHLGSEQREVLVAAASPADLSRLHWEDEVSLIERAFAGSPVRVTVLAHATRTALLNALGTERHAVLHVIGHGGGPNGERLGGLVLEDASGGSDWVTAHDLALTTRVTATLSLVFLNACSTTALAASSHRNLASSVGPALALRGIPAVVGMVREVHDRKAVAFAGTVYTGLRAGASLETAVHIARIAARLDPGQRESWTIPIVFSRMAAQPAAARPPEREPAAQHPPAPPPATPKPGNQATFKIGLLKSRHATLGGSVGNSGDAAGRATEGNRADFEIREIDADRFEGGAEVQGAPDHRGSR